MAARAAQIAAAKLREELQAKRSAAAPAGPFARAAPTSSAADELLDLWGGVEHEIDALEKLHDATGRTIEAWSELPAGSASSISEARELAEGVDQELGKLRGLLVRLERALKIARRVPDVTDHVETIRGFVEGWRKDAEADKQNLLVAARAVILRDPRADGAPGVGMAEIPLPVQVERALADAHVQREARSDEIAALKMLPSADERRSVAKRLLAAIDDEIRLQVELETRVKKALDGAREAGTPPTPELKNAADQLRGWGHGVAYERSRVAPLTA
ncbi:MAG: hypothetical protein HYS27_20535 [Deltaproteobacteria bacterium]|nr:hypothetical protein [Deltaproteobacteria bacterium]